MKLQLVVGGLVAAVIGLGVALGVVLTKDDQGAYMSPTEVQSQQQSYPIEGLPAVAPRQPGRQPSVSGPLDKSEAEKCQRAQADYIRELTRYQEEWARYQTDLDRYLKGYKPTQPREPFLSPPSDFSVQIACRKYR